MLFLSEQKLRAWLGRLAQECRLVAPVKGVNGLVLFEPVKAVEAVAREYQNTALSPKPFLFPQSETLFTVNRRNGGIELVPAAVEPETVLFGIRPCDARGIDLVDKPFLAAPTDTLYQARRNKTALIGMACVSPCAECFCTSMGSGPHDPAGVDVFLTPVPGGYAAQALTEKGKKLLANAGPDEKSATPPPPPEVRTVNSKGIAEAMRKAFDNVYWDRLADRCLHCNVCSYVCPCCYCFDVRDYRKGDAIERVRSWESCESPHFTRAAGGLNPRPGKGARMRQRFAHKLLYFPDLFGELKCTGCGRCVKHCPVNIDIREIINDVQKLGASQ